jgi:pimeloyl-ACP methyl ester carboxylesterase
MPAATVVKEGMLEADGFRIRYVDAGEGAPIVVFGTGAGELFDPLLGKLAGRSRVIALDLNPAAIATARDLPEKLSHALTQLAVERYSVMSVSRGAVLALAQAIATPNQVDKLILLSPAWPPGQSAESAAGLDRVKAPTLVIAGTRDNSGSVEAGRLCRERIHTCHLLFIYDAGHAVAADRLEACAASVSDFLDQGDQFAISRESQMIRP